MIGAGDLVRGLVPVHAGVAFPERRERGLVTREPLDQPSPALVDRLINRTSEYLDSSLTELYPGLQVRPLHADRVVDRRL